MPLPGACPDDGRRFLVDRLWPRGVKKEALRLDAWLKDVAPSKELRRWFGHDPAKWEEFQRRYSAELEAKSEAWQYGQDNREQEIIGMPQMRQTGLFLCTHSSWYGSTPV